MPVELKQAARRKAKANGVGLSAVVRRLLAAWVEDQGDAGGETEDRPHE
jgi:hypothetical protein